MQDELFSMLREQAGEIRESGRAINLLAVEVAKHTEQLANRLEILHDLRDRVEALEATPKPAAPKDKDEAVRLRLMLVLVGGFFTVMIISLYLLAGGDPDDIDKLVPHMSFDEE